MAKQRTMRLTPAQKARQTRIRLRRADLAASLEAYEVAKAAFDAAKTAVRSAGWRLERETKKREEWRDTVDPEPLLSSPEWF